MIMQRAATWIVLEFEVKFD